MARTTKAPVYDPIPMFDLDAYCLEHPPSITRLRTLQTAAQAEADDERMPVAARRHSLIRARAWIDTLIAALDAAGDDDR